MGSFLSMRRGILAKPMAGHSLAGNEGRPGVDYDFPRMSHRGEPARYPSGNKVTWQNPWKNERLRRPAQAQSGGLSHQYGPEASRASRQWVAGGVQFQDAPCFLVSPQLHCGLPDSKDSPCVGSPDGPVARLGPGLCIQHTPCCLSQTTSVRGDPCDSGSLAVPAWTCGDLSQSGQTPS